MLNAFVRHNIQQYGALAAEEATDAEHEERLLVSLVKESYEDTRTPTPDDKDILAEIHAVRAVKAA